MKKTIGLFATGEWAQVKTTAAAVREAMKPDAATVLIRDPELLSADRGQLERFTAVAFCDEAAGEKVRAFYPDAVPVAELLPKAEPARKRAAKTEAPEA